MNKKFKCLILIVLLSFIIITDLSAQGKNRSTLGQYDNYTGWTTPTTPVLPPTEIHPRLLFDSSKITEIKNRKTYDSYFDTLWSKITTNINYYRTKTASSMNENHRPRMAKYCAFAWLMNSDATAKQKAIDALMIAFDNVPRTTTSADFGGDYDEIYRGTWLQNYCEAYDWIKPQLTAAQNDTIRRKLINETCILRNHMVDSTRYAPRPHNHRSKPAYGVATAALTFTSDSRAADWLQFALTQLNTVTKYQFSSDGIYREGGHYNLYSAVNAIPFLYHYKNVSAVNLFEQYKPMFEYFVAARMGQGWIPIFEDSFLKPMPGHMAAREYTTTTTNLHSTAKLSSLLQWSFFNTNLFTQNYTGASNDVCWDIYEYLFYDNTIAKTQPNTSPSINMTGGQTILRKNWNYNDKTNRYLVFNGVAEADNHNHPDLLSFNIEAENAVMATNAGYGPAGADDPKRDSWYLQPYSNNLVTVDSAAPKDLAADVTPRTFHYINGNNYSYVEKDAYYTNGAYWKRGISFPHRNYWIVRDIIRSTTPKTSRFYLHSRGTLITSGINSRWTTPNNYGTQAIFDAYLINSAGSSQQSFTGYFSPFWGSEETAPYISMQSQDSCSLFFSLLFPRSKNSVAPVVNSLSNNSSLYFSILSGDTTDYHFFQKDNLTRTLGVINSDAIYSWFSVKNNLPVSFAVTEGTSLKYNNSTYLTSTSPITMSVQFDNANNVYTSLDTVAASTTIRIKLPFNVSLINSFYLNGILKSYSVESDSIIYFSLSTITSQDIQSIASGNWGSSSTWSSGTVPLASDNVIITGGTTVIINNSNSACNNLNISTNSSLLFSNTDSTKLTVNGDLSIAANSTFSVQIRAAAGTPIIHSFDIKGNFNALDTVIFRAGSNASNNVCAATVSFTGNASCFLNAPDGSNFNSIIINKSGNASVSLRSNITQNNNSTTAPSILSLTSGKVYAGSYLWKVLATGQSAGVIGGSAGSYIVGALYRQTPSGSNISRTFAVGDSFYYRPVTIFIPTGISNFPISVTPYSSTSRIPGNLLNGGIDRISNLRHFKITNHHASSSMAFSSFSLNYNNDDGITANNSELRIAASQDNKNNWYNLGPDSTKSRKHTTGISPAPIEIRSDDTTLTITAGNSVYLTFAQTTGGRSNSLGVNSLNLTAISEGLYNPVADTVRPDTFTVFLAQSVFPYNVIDSAKIFPDKDGKSYCMFPGIGSDTFYLILKHRNSIETWSKTTRTFLNYNLNYNFSDSPEKAFGNNLKLSGSKYTIYSGDVNQDGVIDFKDILSVDSDYTNNNSGYLKTDLNYDGIVSSDDLQMVINNNQNYIIVKKP